MNNKIWLVLLLNVCAAFAAAAHSLGGLVEISSPPGWNSVDPHKPGTPPIPFPTLKFIPADDRNATVLVTLFPSKLAHVSDEKTLREFQLIAIRPFLPSPTFEPVVTKLRLTHALGLATSLEDPDLVGKPSSKGQYKFATSVVLLLENQTTVQATIFTDAVDSSEFKEAMRLIESATPQGPAPTAGAGGASGDKISVDSLSAALQLPPGRFHPSDLGVNQDPGYFLYADGRGVTLSVWLDRSAKFKGMRSFWEGEKKAIEEKAGLPVADESFKIVGGWNIVQYSVGLGGGVAQKNMRACRTNGNTWADVHLSITGEDTSYSDLEDVLKTLTLAPK